MVLKLTRKQYTDLYGPTTGDKIRVGDSDLLMEVELPVSVSFGRAHLPLRDVLKKEDGRNACWRRLCAAVIPNGAGAGMGVSRLRRPTVDAGSVLRHRRQRHRNHHAERL